MGDLYSELLIKRKTPLIEQIAKIVMIVGTAASVLLYLLTLQWVFLIVFIALAVADYFLIPGFNLEYEYLYVNGELDIDKIMSKTKRKRVCSLNLTEKLEIMAPLSSHALDSYRNRKDMKVSDYSSGVENKAQFGLVMQDERGKFMVIIEPDDVIINDIKRIAPRKVSTF
ncbi:MAG: DUF6106 family protein [Lachnospiraceae bacterium]|nr:DUF6106 family protein [Robinsoniella sp.]MDY3766190.1 DUF6106 family protein [Lachnospiraceae bacterium]